jgi:hypothetical protein
MGTFSLWVLGEREGSRPANKISIKDNTIMNVGKNVGDKVIWMQVKYYGNQKELSKREGVIASIDGNKATVALTGYGAGNVTVPLADLTLASQDTRMSILEFAMRKFGANAQQ